MTLAEVAKHFRLAEDFLAKQGVTEILGQGVAVAFYDADGRHRADVIWSDFADIFSGGWTRTTPLLPYGLWHLPQARHDRLLFVVPEAADCWTLWFHGLPALALPNVAALERAHLQDIDTVVVTPGSPRWCPLFVKQIETKLLQLEFQGTAFSLRLVNALTNPADLHKSYGEQFRDLWARSLTEASPLRSRPGSPPAAPPVLPSFDPVPPVPIAVAAPSPSGAEPNPPSCIAKKYVNLGILASDIRPVPLEWLWQSIIPKGRPTLLDGDPDQGKSLVALDLVARLTTGRPMPMEDSGGRGACRAGEDGSAGASPFRRPPAGALLLVEDNLNDTVRQRLEAAGAALERVVVLNRIPRQNRPPQLPEDIPFLRQAMERVEAGLVVIDPLASFLGPRVVLGHEAHMRCVLQALAQLGEETGAAILLLRHLAKAWRWNPLYRGAGSMAVMAHCRSALWLAPDPEDRSRRVLAVTKSNLAARPPSQSLLLPGDASQAVCWQGESPWTAETLMQALQSQSAVVLPDAMRFLRTALADGPRPSAELLADAQSQGISARTLRRAKKLLGIDDQPVHPPQAPHYWVWTWPAA